MKTISRRLPLGTAALGAGVLAAAALVSNSASACTACYVAAHGKVLVGNNEDFGNPATKVWFVPRGTGKYGRMCQQAPPVRRAAGSGIPPGGVRGIGRHCRIHGPRGPAQLEGVNALGRGRAHGTPLEPCARALALGEAELPEEP